MIYITLQGGEEFAMPNEAKTYISIYQILNFKICNFYSKYKTKVKLFVLMPKLTSVCTSKPRIIVTVSSDGSFKMQVGFGTFFLV